MQTLFTSLVMAGYLTSKHNTQIKIPGGCRIKPACDFQGNVLNGIWMPFRFFLSSSTVASFWTLSIHFSKIFCTSWADEPISAGNRTGQTCGRTVIPSRTPFTSQRIFLAFLLIVLSNRTICWK